MEDTTPVIPITIKEGADFDFTFFCREVNVLGEPVSLGSYTRAEAQLWTYPGGTRLATFDATIDAEGGSVNIKLPFAITDDLNFRSAHYDVFLIYGNDEGRDKLVKGPASWEAKVTVVEDA